MLKNVDAENGRPTKNKLDGAILSKLRTACEIYDVDGVNEAIAVIENYKYETDNELAIWLTENAKLTNFRQIVDKLSTLPV